MLNVSIRQSLSNNANHFEEFAGRSYWDMLIHILAARAGHPVSILLWSASRKRLLRASPFPLTAVPQPTPFRTLDRDPAQSPLMAKSLLRYHLSKSLKINGFLVCGLAATFEAREIKWLKYRYFMFAHKCENSDQATGWGYRPNRLEFRGTSALSVCPPIADHLQTAN